MRVHSDLNQLPVFSKTVITIGSFDGVHTGHRRILDQVNRLARERGAESVVITFEPHPRTVIGTPGKDFRLISDISEKISLFEQTGINHVVIAPFTREFAGLSAREYVESFLLHRFDPQLIVIGYDHRFGHDRNGDIHFLKSYAAAHHFEVLEIPPQEVDDITVSSSKIRTALEAADITAANRLLSHPFLLTGRVVEGNKIGRSIGFPTANLAIANPYKLIPPEGIYAVGVRLPAEPEKRHTGMLYIGTRPTIDGAKEQRIEVNIIDFEGDLYGKEITLEVIDFIRGDKKLDGLAALQAQIAADKVAILERMGEGATALSSAKATTLEDSAPTMQLTTDVAIVILNYNTRDQLLHYLPAVLEHSKGARIILADNGSPDDSIAVVKSHFPQVEILDLKTNFGFAEGYNRALEQVEADIVVLLNSDVEVTAGWMEPILNAMQDNPEIGIAQPKILADKKRDTFEHAGASGGWMDLLGYPFCRGRIFTEVEQDKGQYDQSQPCFWASGAAFFIRAKVYKDFGGFDGDYFAHNEEIDLCWRVKRAGYSVWCFPASKVYHLGGGTLGYESPRKVYLNFRNSLFTLLKNERSTKLLWLIPARLLLDGVAAAMYLSKGQFAAIKAILQAHFSFYKGFFPMLRKRKAIQVMLKTQKLPGKEEDQAGIYPKSIVFRHYIGRVKRFSDL